MKLVKFTFDGMEASVDSTGFVRLVGAGFHIENAQPDIRAAIDDAVRRQCDCECDSVFLSRHRSRVHCTISIYIV